MRLLGFDDGEVEAEKSGLLRERGWIGRTCLELKERAALGGVRGGVKRIGGPLDEERKSPRRIIFQRQSLPFQHAAIGALAGTGRRPFESDACLHAAFLQTQQDHRGARPSSPAEVPKAS